MQVSAEVGPSESECRPFIEKALHELKGDDSEDSGKKFKNKKNLNQN